MSEDATAALDPVRRRWGEPIVQLAVGAVVLFACLFALGRIAEDIHEQEANVLDTVLDPWLHRLASPALDAFMGAITILGSVPGLPILFVLAVVALVRVGRRRETALLVVALGGSVAINQALKLIFHRPRPHLAWAAANPEYSFPSGHSQNGLVFYLSLALIAWGIWGHRRGIAAVVAALVLALLIGLSRLYFGVHYFTDVVGGFFAGFAWLLIVVGALRAWPLVGEWRNGRQPPPGTSSGDS